MLNKWIRHIARAGAAAGICFALLLGAYDYMIPDRVSCHAGEAVPTYPGLQYSEKALPAIGNADGTDALTVRQSELRMFGLLPLKNVDVVSYADLRLYPGGMPFGVKLYTDGVMVVGFGDVDSESGAVNPAYAAGLRQKDMITHLNGQRVSSVEMLTSVIEASGGEPVAVTYTRAGTVQSTTFTPVRSVSDGRYKAGMWVRDSGAGIGTVTFIDPTTGAFGGLGHGICDSDTGELLPMQRGIVSDVRITSVLRGTPGIPGELRGTLGLTKQGALLGNTACGVFGLFTALPTAPEAPLPVALKSEVHAGAAYIWCSLDDAAPARYAVELSSINKTASGSKSFVVRVVDPVLLEKTGGIIQGMSGSPIIQDGRLVGAVTHVLINDPTTGYGIFLETMLAEMPEQLR